MGWISNAGQASVPPARTYRSPIFNENVSGPRFTEAVLRFSGGVQRRMSEAGVEGVAGVMALYNQLRGALGKVTGDELDWAAGEVSRLIDSLTRIGDDLQRLKALKVMLDTGH